MATVSFHGSRADLMRIMRQVPAVLAGRAPDPWGIAHGLQLRLGVGLLSKVQQSFIQKSRGETGDDGVTWPPLKRATIAQRRTTSAERRQLGITGKRERGLLTPAQNQRWSAIFRGQKARLIAKFGMGDREASAKAAQLAWAILKREGAKTKLDVLGGRQVDTLRDTGELFRSFSPGVEDQPSGADGQIFRTPPGRVIVGTNKKVWHHRGIPGRLPARPFWPHELPEHWWQFLLGLYRTGLVRVLVGVIQRGAA